MGLFFIVFLYIVMVIYIRYVLIISILISALLLGCSNNDKEMGLLVGKVILIDPGHGGKDDGASYNGVVEDEINLSIAMLLQEKLLENGVYAIVTRNGDYDLADMYSNNRKMKDLKQRVKIINESEVDLFISLHMNVYQNEMVSGGQVFYQNNNESSRIFASILQDGINKIQDKSRKEMKGDYYILNNTNRVGVLMEMGFLTSTKDVEKMSDKGYRNTLTNTIINSIKKYFGG